MTSSTNYPARLGQAVGTASVQTGIAMPKLVDWLCQADQLAELAVMHHSDAPRLQQLRGVLGLSPEADLHQITYAVRNLVEAGKAPVDVVLHCPACKTQHIDSYEYQEWDNPPHRTHKCHACGALWTPCDRNTNGVRAVKPGSSASWPVADATLFAPERLPARDQYGFVFHPDFPTMGEEEVFAPFLWLIGHECAGVDMEGDAPAALWEKYSEEGDPDCSAWTPTAPEGGYRLAAIYDTEDGPHALFVRPIAHLVRAAPQPSQGDSTDYHGSGLPL